MPERLIKHCVFAAVDFESAGAERGETDQPVQIGIVRGSFDGTPPEMWTSYIAPGKEVLWSASMVHGITADMLAGAPPLLGLWGRVRDMLGGGVVVGHNLGTEKRYLRTFPGHGFGPWLDTLALARTCLPGLADYSLQSVAAALGVAAAVDAAVPGKTWHDALYDAAASWLALQKIVAELNLLEQPLYCFGNAVKK